MDDFNKLLAELNTGHGLETEDFSSDNKGKKSFSFEEKSKISKNCVHYMKFTKGKDLPSQSKTGLDCILGNRQNKKTPEDAFSPATPGESETTARTTGAFPTQADGRTKEQATGYGCRALPYRDPNGKERRKEKKEAKKIKMWRITLNPRPRRRESKLSSSWRPSFGTRIQMLLLRRERIVWGP